MNTNGLVAPKIVKTPYSSFVSGANISNLSSHLKNSFYIASTNAPSFLDRLEGRIVASDYGIESLVNLDELAKQGISVKQKSVIDYIYFSEASGEGCRVLPSGMPSWFRLDNAHLVSYGVTCA